MAKRVFILGAGASVHAAAPLMNSFLDKARDLYPVIRDQRRIFSFINLYALATVSTTILRRFTVIDTNTEIESRFKRLLGPAARDRFREPYLFGFEGAMNGANNVPSIWE